MSDVRPQVSGIVKARRFVEGMQVKEGQVLYEIDPSLYQAAYDQAQADLANAQAAASVAKLKAQRYAKILEIHGVSQQDVDDAKAAADQAAAAVALKSAALETARINLAYTQLRAPISGRIGKSSVTAGALVTANQDQPLATIRALDPIYVDLTQSSAQLLRLRRQLSTDGLKLTSASVRLKLEDGSDYGRVGTLQFQEVSVDEATGSVTLRAQFPNPDGVLLPGMYVRAVLSLATGSNAILAPQQGITRDARGNPVAMIVDNNKRVEQRSLVADQTVGDQWLITSGLAEGDQLIVEGLNRIHAGDTVRPVIVGSDAAAANSGTPASSEPGAASGARGR